jgi:hypothetical protein
MPFQSTVNQYPAPAVAGDFASSNPRTSVLAGEGGLIAGPGGVTVGNFAWNNNGIVQSYGTAPNAPDGIVHREMQALIQTYLAESGANIPEGFMVTLFNEGDFWVKNNSASATTMNEAVYARYSDGAAVPGSSAPSGASVTGSLGSTFTAQVSANSETMVVTNLTGLLSIGETVSHTDVPTGTTVAAFVSGTSGGNGTYTLSANATASNSSTGTSFGNLIDVTAIGSGSLAVGDPISGGSLPSNAVIDAQVSGTSGGIGVYQISIPGTAYSASATLTATGGIVTSWKCKSIANPGELVKISTWL